MKKKVLSIIISLLLVVSLVSSMCVTAIAEGDDDFCFGMQVPEGENFVGTNSGFGCLLLDSGAATRYNNMITQYNNLDKMLNLFNESSCKGVENLEDNQKVFGICLNPNANFWLKEGKTFTISNNENGISIKGTVETKNNSNLIISGNLLEIKLNAYGMITIEKNGYLDAEIDIKSSGSLNWIICKSYLEDFSKVTNAGKLMLTVNKNISNGKYLLAGKASNISNDNNNETFILTGLSGIADKNIIVNGATVVYGNKSYTLFIDENNNLVLKVRSVLIDKALSFIKNTVLSVLFAKIIKKLIFH